jgi:hypothetical protein
MDQDTKTDNKLRKGSKRSPASPACVLARRQNVAYEPLAASGASLPSISTEGIARPLQAIAGAPVHLEPLISF